MLASALLLAASLPFPACIDPLERHFNLPAGIVNAVIAVESGGRVDAVNRANRNGTTDFGLMQVNSSHLPRLAAHGIDEKRLLSDPCANVAAGANILREALDSSSGAIVPALSRYNTGRFSETGFSYAQKVLARWNNGGAAIVHAANARRESISPARSPLIVASAKSFGEMSWR
jgi:soluble lytic murein transglycosylase-like protein